MSVKRRVLYALKDILCLAVIAATMFVMLHFVVLHGKVPSSSMEPTLKVGAHFIADRLAFVNKKPERYDILVFKAPDTEELYIKRVIGLPGEHVELINGDVFVDGEKVRDDFLKEQPADETYDFGNVPADSYFMMGDNRNDSLDSRFWEHTFLPFENIVAKAWFSFFPSFSDFV